MVIDERISPSSIPREEFELEGTMEEVVEEFQKYIDQRFGEEIVKVPHKDKGFFNRIRRMLSKGQTDWTINAIRWRF